MALRSAVGGVSYRAYLLIGTFQIATDYRSIKKSKLQRTFVSASDAAEDRARGVKREGGIIVDGPLKKTHKIQFVKPGQVNGTDAKSDDENKESNHTNAEIVKEEKEKLKVVQKSAEQVLERIDYVEELSQIKCLDIRMFRYNMFMTRFGKLVLLVRPWTGKLWNIQSSCQVCGLNLKQEYSDDSGKCSLFINGALVAEGSASTKVLAKKQAGDLVWNMIKEETVILLIKEQFIAQNDTRISVSEVSGTAAPVDDQFGAPVEISVASKMMKIMGWKGGGLGADAQGISEPIKPHLQMVNRAGLGSTSGGGIKQMRRAAEALMRRYSASSALDTLDVDLVFSSDFSQEERAVLHLVAKNARLVSHSYGKGDDRFLVVRKKLDPFTLVQAVIEKGGNTPKYQVFIPAVLARQSNYRS